MRLHGGMLLILAAHVGSATARDEQPPTFERDVRPILKAYCLECHGGGAKLRGKLDLRLIQKPADAFRFVERGDPPTPPGASSPP
jgi:hypothetical protein